MAKCAHLAPPKGVQRLELPNFFFNWEGCRFKNLPVRLFKIDESEGPFTTVRQQLA